MLTQLLEELREWWRGVRPRFAAAWEAVGPAARAAWSIIRPPLVLALQIAAALIVLFEEWGWRPLVELISRLARFALWSRLELWIAGLPPYGALAALALPTSILLPLKFVAVFLLANGHYFAATALFIGAKITSTALIARIFMLTMPALMQIGWFARGYNFFMPWKDAIFAEIRASWAWRYGRMVKTRISHEAKQAWARWKPGVEAAIQQWRPRLTAALGSWRLWARERWAVIKPSISAIFTLAIL